ncbi:ADP-ribosylglycohydrolase family protein [Thermococcus sp. 21S7]|uniref:ADP-ribosylglycohydrolase family protein n=1 Tax=Thermococcus sp. 21S7 TaxID=1638221 RepID=UPI00143ABD76|nr:ADP-ribosylglycohydrolase family protein [Thermococcus sp. 21S7]NJE60379.1 hypothetical protein [Thermococcus sp. 21S7]
MEGTNRPDQKLSECGDNLCIMDALFDAGVINAEQSEVLYKKLRPPSNVPLSKIKGMLLGVAIGDALGAPIEGKPPEEPEMRVLSRYFPTSHITDDTQLTFLSLEVFLEEGWFNPKKLADRFTKERIIGIGRSVKKFIKRYKELNMPWYLAGVESAGNGALMKLSPVVIPPFLSESHSTFSDSVIMTCLTHNDRLAISSAVSFTNLLWKLLTKNKPPEPEWWKDEYVEIAREVEGDSSVYRPRFGKFNNRYSGPAWDFVDRVLEMALRDGWTLFDMNKAVGSGAYLLETVPMALYTMILYGNNLDKALSTAVLNSKDSDTIGAIVGYLSGALHGITEFPPSLVEPLFGGNMLPHKFLDALNQTEEILANGMHQRLE